MARHRRHDDLLDDAPPVRMTAEGVREAARLFAYVRPYRRKFVAAQVFLLVSTLAGLAFPYFTGRLIDATQRGSGRASAAALLPMGTWDVNRIALVLLLVLAVQSFCSFF